MPSDVGAKRVSLSVFFVLNLNPQRADLFQGSLHALWGLKAVTGRDPLGSVSCLPSAASQVSYTARAHPEALPGAQAALSAAESIYSLRHGTRAGGGTGEMVEGACGQSPKNLPPTGGTPWAKLS